METSGQAEGLVTKRQINVYACQGTLNEQFVGHSLAFFRRTVNISAGREVIGGKYAVKRPFLWFSRFETIRQDAQWGGRYWAKCVMTLSLVAFSS
jgi:hypothetical protein